MTLILNGAKIDCTVAPGVVFYSVYECDNAWETSESYGAAVDTGAEGSGVLNITSTFEGLDTELHLTVNGGSLHILAGLGSEGDGIDSNGYVVINGGTVVSLASPMADSGLDSDCGTYVNGGTVVALGASMDWAESDGSENAGQAAVNLSFSQRQSADEAIVITDTDGKVVFAYDPDKDEVAEGNARWYSGTILSAPGLTVGGEYYIYVGGDVEGEVVFSLSEKVNGFTGVRDTE